MNGKTFDVRFSIKRSTFVFMHEAITMASDGLVDLRTVMPGLAATGASSLASRGGTRAPLHWVNSLLDTQQRMAVQRILEGQYAPLPFMVFGPPGTGKTR